MEVWTLLDPNNSNVWINPQGTKLLVRELVAPENIDYNKTDKIPYSVYYNIIDIETNQKTSTIQK